MAERLGRKRLCEEKQDSKAGGRTHGVTLGFAPRQDSYISIGRRRELPEPGMAEETVNGVKLLVLDADGTALSSEADALDVIGQTYGMDIDAVVVPANRFAPE